MKLNFRKRRGRGRRRSVNWDVNETAVCFLASLHRHFLFFILPVEIVTFIIWKDDIITGISIAVIPIIYGIWTFFARLFECRHFYCSCQLFARKIMTPYDVRFDELTLWDGYIEGIICFIGGIIFLLEAIF